MKKLSLILVLGLLYIILLGSCISQNLENVSVEFELFGTWMNPDYEGEMGRLKPKIVLHPNGDWDEYRSAADTEPKNTFEIVITNKWTDSKGNNWYTFRVSGAFFENWFPCLARVSNSGKTLEYIFGSKDYPMEFYPSIPSDAPGYTIFNRK